MKKKIIILILLIFSDSCVLVFNYAKTKNIKESTPIKIEKVEEDKPVKENDHLMDATRYFVKTKKICKIRRSL